MHLVEFALGPLETNCFLLHNKQEALAVDVGGDPGHMLAYLKKNALSLKLILITHLHFDHVLGAADLQDATGATLHCSALDLPLLEAQNSLAYMFPPVRPFRHTPMSEGELTRLDEPCRVFATPGHSPGSMSYHFPRLGALFCGDVLFYNSVGRTDFEGGNSAVLARSIREKIYTLPEETKVYPGHGQTTSVRVEKRTNPFVPAED
ncbi:MAG: MBL fold metallo-hydrolase [Deltaproteobacteria bacterium]|jgi:glyoxylase-like metal-dependent hydrolase (beta-lactamase superfamily II)|nr:MBL fold metallo-hydrolase [Deltaproteobacteria bacterium]